MTMRSKLVWVLEPMYLDNQRMRIGMKEPKIPATAGGSRPDTNVNVIGDWLSHVRRKGM